ncbi:MAG TPA: BON domain-containing protein [Longimicrobiales bacterium]
MFRDRRAESRKQLWTVGVGVAAGLWAGLALARRSRRGREPGGARALDTMERRVADALEAEGLLGRFDIEVGALSDGIVELTGTVRDESDADRAVAVAQRVAGVGTVLNRLDTEILEEHLAETRMRHAERGPGERETHWYGNLVGTGMRRQGHETDPARPDDRIDIVTRELGVDRAEEAASESLDKLAPAVAGHTTQPAAPSDRDVVDRASHRRLGNVPAEPVQELNPESGIHENVKKGTELTLEDAGLEEELIERDLKDRS